MNFRFEYDYESDLGTLFLPNTTSLEGSKAEWQQFVNALQERKTYSGNRLRVLRESTENKWDLLLDAAKYAHSDEDFYDVNYAEADSIAREIGAAISEAAFAIHSICDRMEVKPEIAKKMLELEDSVDD